tara:strand:- start:1274 stop:1684 length:411 start_codon:yes stop_codon:yes gene_type:complete
MKKSELKQLIKPLVKECIHEVLLEEGLLANIVSEVATGLGGTLMVEAREIPTPPQTMSQKASESRTRISEHRAKLMNAMNKDAYNGVNLFEGTEPFNNYEAAAPKKGSVDLGHPGDSGVDISSLVGGASKIWKAMK